MVIAVVNQSNSLARAMWVSLLVFAVLVGYSTENPTSNNSLDSLQICPPKFLPIGEHCYFFSKRRATWQDAHWKCDHINSSLVSITKPEEDDALRNVLNARKEGQSERWIDGIYDWKQAVWRWGATGEILNYQGFSWKFLERRDKLEWHCIILDPKMDNKWNSRKCTIRKHFICKSNQNIATIDSSSEAPAFIRERPVKTKRARTKKIFACNGEMIVLGNKCYTFSQNPSPWYEAFFKCREQNATLATVNNRGQDMRLKKFLNKGFVEKHERWLGGLYDWKKKTWKWALDGQQVRYKNFTFNHPTNPSTLKWHCITLDPKQQHQWSSKICTDSKHFICQKKAETVIRLGEKERKPDAEIIILDDRNANMTKTGIETKIYPKRRRPNRRKFTKTLHHESGTQRKDYAQIIILNDQPRQQLPDATDSGVYPSR